MQAARVPGKTGAERGVQRRQRMSSDGDHEGAVTPAEASAACPPTGDTQGADGQRAAGPRQPEGEAPAGAPGFRYAIRVETLLHARWSEWLGGMTITHEAGGLTRLEGAVKDQAALYGLLIKLRDLCLTIVTLE